MLGGVLYLVTFVPSIPAVLLLAPALDRGRLRHLVGSRSGRRSAACSCGYAPRRVGTAVALWPVVARTTSNARGGLAFGITHHRGRCHHDRRGLPARSRHASPRRRRGRCRPTPSCTWPVRSWRSAGGRFARPGPDAIDQRRVPRLRAAPQQGRPASHPDARPGRRPAPLASTLVTYFNGNHQIAAVAAVGVAPIFAGPSLGLRLAIRGLASPTNEPARSRREALASASRCAKPAANAPIQHERRHVAARLAAAGCIAAHLEAVVARSAADAVALEESAAVESAVSRWRGITRRHPVLRLPTPRSTRRVRAPAPERGDGGDGGRSPPAGRDGGGSVHRDGSDRSSPPPPSARRDRDRCGLRHLGRPARHDNGAGRTPRPRPRGGASFGLFHAQLLLWRRTSPPATCATSRPTCATTSRSTAPRRGGRGGARHRSSSGTRCGTVAPGGPPFIEIGAGQDALLSDVLHEHRLTDVVSWTDADGDVRGPRRPTLRGE